MATDSPPTNVPVRDAATVVLVRDADENPKVLMGQRGAEAAFMPNKFVFPGGAVDAQDASVVPADTVSQPSLERLSQSTDTDISIALAAAAIRELWEEAGQILGVPGAWSDPIAPNWQTFAQTGHQPSAKGLHFIFRAVTPVGRPRRFDARFFCVDAAQLASDPDDFSRASDELSHLQWVPISDARRFNLPFITEVVLAEVSASLPHIKAPETVPFYNNSDEFNRFEQLGGRSPLA